MKIFSHYQHVYMKLILLSIIAILFAECENDQMNTPTNNLTVNDTSSTNNDSLVIVEIPTDSLLSMSNIKYLALGDSYTIGQSVRQDESWPFILKNQLQKNNLTVDSIKVIARTGWRTDNLQNAIHQYPIHQLKSTFNVVSLLIGVNNQFQGGLTEQFGTEYEVLLEQAIEIAGSTKRVIVLSIPDYGVTPFGGGDQSISAAIDEYNQIKKQITISKGVQFYDITAISRNAKNDLSLLADDGLHPSGKMYQEWVDRILRNVLTDLGH